MREFVVQKATHARSTGNVMCITMRLPRAGAVLPQLTAGRNRWALLMAQLHSLLPSRQDQAQLWKYSMVLSSGKGQNPCREKLLLLNQSVTAQYG